MIKTVGLLRQFSSASAQGPGRGHSQINMIRNRLGLRFALCAAPLLYFLIASSAAAQETPSGNQQAPAANTQQPSASTPAPQAPQTPEEKKERKEEENTGTSNDRLFWTLPNFLTVDTQNIPPLSTGQKFKVVTRSSFDYIEYPWYGLLAGISQAENSEPEYGQGAEGYGKRYGAAFADGTIENFMVGAIVPSLLHQDPRYYQLGKGGFWHRTGYALSRLVITRSDSGQREFNYSEVLGSGASAAISTFSYHPSAERTASNTMSVWGTQVGYDALTYFVREFWPDIHRKFRHKKS